MNQLLSSPFARPILVCLFVAFFGMLYAQTVLYLPLFGDATIHGANAIDVLKKGWIGLEAEYPSFYSYLMSLLYVFFGEKGLNLVPFIGFIFLLCSTFLFIQQITKNYYLGLFAIVLVGFSPKIIFYSSRMYQEILIGAFFLFSIYLLFRYLDEKEKIFLFLLAYFIGIVAAMKQQGLFILYPTMVIFFFIKGLLTYRKESILDSAKNFLIILLIPLLTCASFYGVLFNTTGKIQPGSDEFALLNVVNQVGQQIFFYKGDLFTGVQNEKLRNSFNEIDEKYSKVAFKRAEQRHIWPTDLFTNFDKFNQANNLYVHFQGIEENIFVILAIFIGLIGGFLYCLTHFKYYHNLLLFTVIFLSVNYTLFIRNSDQQRYHLFLPIFLLSFVLIFFHVIINRINFSKYLKLCIIVVFVLLLFLPSFVQRIELNKKWENSQLYSPSEGGIASIQEAGNWMKTHSSEQSTIGQQCNNETHYYFDRPVIGDWETYFLSENDLKSYFKEKKISYYVIYTSQIVNDNEWEIICWVPKSFYNRMEKLFTRAYTSQKGDVIIYSIVL